MLADLLVRLQQNNQHLAAAESTAAIAKAHGAEIEVTAAPCQLSTA